MSTSAPYDTTIRVDEVIQQMNKLLHAVENEELANAHLLSQVHPANYQSARNLIHYMALRSFDLRQLQEQLTSLGVSSIAHAEGYVLMTINNIIRLLYLLKGETISHPAGRLSPPFNYYQSREQLLKNTDALFGIPKEGDNRTRVMVTMPVLAATDFPLLVDLMNAGMDLIRINTSHDQPEQWKAMIDNIRKAEEETQRRCLIYIDLSGPKLRAEKPILLREDQTERLKHNGSIRLFKGDWVAVISPDLQPFELELPERVILSVPVTLPEIFRDVEIGHSIFFDDGKIGGRIVFRTENYFLVEIFQAAISGTGLGAEKGINLPETALTLSSLTHNDYATLPFIAKYADIVGYSFVRRPSDVEKLQSTLSELGRPDIGIVLKIETKEAFDYMPHLLLTAMRNPKVGIMIARGDLAVEVGFERNAEVQEEILWICESGHVPGIWATQVLDRMAKKGLATRSEITDAAMASRAECVMLNKGPHIVDAVNTLENIIKRMERHQRKRWGSLRPLSVARRFVHDTIHLPEGK